LARWLPERRWFAGKGHRITGLKAAARTPIPGVSGAEHLIVAAGIDGCPFQLYQVPVLLADQEFPDSLIGSTPAGNLHDGLLHADVMAGLLSASALPAQLNPTNSPVPPQAQWLGPSVEVTGYRVLNVEQSNTCVVFADRVLVKVFRMLSAGINPDIEVHAGLFSVDCHDVGQLLGWINGGWTDPSSQRTVHGHLAMIQEFFPGSVDGWDLARAEVAASRDFTEESRALGAATARVHRDLAQAFPTAELGDSQILAMGNRLHDRLSAAADIVPEVARLAPGLRRKLDRLGDLGHIEVQRVHGDYHLGQALRTPDGWRVLDFEGEPGAELDSRRVLDNPMRDVAAMLRSFAYAAWQGAADSDAARAWQADCQQAFLDGYAATSGVDPASHEVLLTIYTVDKAAYEAIYEQRNRPDWVEIPLVALRSLARSD
jgi:maltokinase